MPHKGGYQKIKGVIICGHNVLRLPSYDAIKLSNILTTSIQWMRTGLHPPCPFSYEKQLTQRSPSPLTKKLPGRYPVNNEKILDKPTAVLNNRKQHSFNPFRNETTETRIKKKQRVNLYRDMRLSLKTRNNTFVTGETPPKKVDPEGISNLVCNPRILTRVNHILQAQ